jgi:hypothetical protein
MVLVPKLSLTSMKEIMKWLWLPIMVFILLSTNFDIAWVNYVKWAVSAAYLIGIVYLIRKDYIKGKDNNGRLYFTVFTLVALLVAYAGKEFFYKPKAKAIIESYNNFKKRV